MNIFVYHQSNQKRWIKYWTVEKANIKEAGKGIYTLSGKRRKPNLVTNPREKIYSSEKSMVTRQWLVLSNVFN